MTRVLLTGGSGFIAAHILEQLLTKGHSVVTTVRSEEKAAPIRAAYPDKTSDELSIVIVPDIAKPDAFDEVVKVPGIEVVFHTASPFYFNFKDAKTELIDPAVIGTTGILKAIARSAPSVRRVVVTSSFAAIVDEAQLSDPSTTFTEDSWNPVTLADIHNGPATAYRASKTLAERAAWDFVNNAATTGAKFELVTINPPLVFGPVAHHLESLEAVNTSNQRLVGLIEGQWKQAIPPTGQAFIWVDVRDVATAHVKAGLEIPEAAGQRFFTTTGEFTNREIVDIVRRNFPELADKLPGSEVPGGDLPAERYKSENTKSREVLKMDWISLEKSITDTIKTLLAHKA